MITTLNNYGINVYYTYVFNYEIAGSRVVQNLLLIYSLQHNFRSLLEMNKTIKLNIKIQEKNN